MANQKLSELANAGALSAADLLYIVQDSDSRKVAASDLITGLIDVLGTLSGAPSLVGSTGNTGANGATGTPGQSGTTGATGPAFAGSAPYVVNATGPTTGDVADGQWTIWLNTGANSVSIVANVGGSLRSITLT